MKPDSEIFYSQAHANLNYQFVSKNKHPPHKIDTRHKYQPSLSKTLKQQVESVPKQRWISDAAYYKAKARGFAPDHELADWLDAEQEYVEMLVEWFLSVFREDATVTLTGLQQLAKAIGIPKPEKIDSKLELIRLIQATSHHRPCFRTKPGEFCHEQDGCQWQTECQKLVAEWWR